MNPTATEISITIKNSEQRYTQKFLIYELYHMNESDPIVSQCLSEAKKNFGSNEIESISIKSKLTL